jgi:hypothetical protein
MKNMIENKVTGAAAGAGGATVTANFILWLLGEYASADAASAPAVVGFVTFVVATAGAFLGGYFSRHTGRGYGVEGEILPFGDVDSPGPAM